MAVIAGLIGLAVAPGNPVLVGKAAAIAGAVVFGGACAIRAFRDEIAMIVAAYAEGSLDATTEALRGENNRLLAEVERLKSEGMVADAWGARAAAERLMTSYFGAVAANQDVDGHLARAQSMQRGMSRAQWEQGIRFLPNAGVLDRGRRWHWTAGSEEAALAAIARHAAVSRVSVRAANGDMAKSVVMSNDDREAGSGSSRPGKLTPSRSSGGGEWDREGMRCQAVYGSLMIWRIYCAALPSLRCQRVTAIIKPGFRRH